MLRPNGDWLARVEFAAGETFRFDGAHIHRMRHAAGEIALTVHVYSPPLGRAGAYELSRRRHAAPPQHRRRRGAARERHVPGAPRRRGSAARRARRRSRSSARQPRSRSSTHTPGSPLELAPHADQRRAHRQRRIAARLLLVEHARQRQPRRPASAARRRWCGARRRRRSRPARAARAPGCPRPARRPASSRTRSAASAASATSSPDGRPARWRGLAPCGCSKIAATGAARCSAAPSRHEPRDRVVQRERQLGRLVEQHGGERVGVELAHPSR